MNKQELVVKLLESIGEDPEREGLVGTPDRVVRSWEELFSGYSQDPVSILSTDFIDGSCDEMVILKGIDFYSTCEHHLQPFFGKVSIGYLPDKKVVGISKMIRLVEVFARRLQIQERLTSQIADIFDNVVKPQGIMVVCEAEHLCMKARGVRSQNSIMVTSAVRGAFDSDPTVRKEFMELIR